jgi:hypothetical protein
MKIIPASNTLTPRIVSRAIGTNTITTPEPQFERVASAVPKRNDNFLVIVVGTSGVSGVRKRHTSARHIAPPTIGIIVPALSQPPNAECCTPPMVPAIPSVNKPIITTGIDRAASAGILGTRINNITKAIANVILTKLSQTYDETPKSVLVAVDPDRLTYEVTYDGETNLPVNAGNYTLTLSNVVPYTLYFSDRPDRIAGFTTIEDFISGFDWSVAPNAAISRPGAKESEDTMIMELSDPQYTASAHQLTYTAHVMNNYKGDKLSEFVDKSDPTLPTDQIGRAHV